MICNALSLQDLIVLRRGTYFIHWGPFPGVVDVAFKLFAGCWLELAAAHAKLLYCNFQVPWIVGCCGVGTNCNPSQLHQAQLVSSEMDSLKSLQPWIGRMLECAIYRAMGGVAKIAAQCPMGSSFHLPGSCAAQPYEAFWRVVGGWDALVVPTALSGCLSVPHRLGWAQTGAPRSVRGASHQQQPLHCITLAAQSKQSRSSPDRCISSWQDRNARDICTCVLYYP